MDSEEAGCFLQVRFSEALHYITLHSVTTMSHSDSHISSMKQILIDWLNNWLNFTSYRHIHRCPYLVPMMLKWWKLCMMSLYKLFFFILVHLITCSGLPIRSHILPINSNTTQCHSPVPTNELIISFINI